MLETDLLVGMAGWDHDEWVGGFFPPDLPDDWRLGFYTNRLRAVLVPHATWQQPDLDTSTWRDDLYPEFRMVLEWTLPADAPVAAVEAFLAQHEPIKENVDAYLVSVVDVGNAAREAIGLLGRHRPVCLTSNDPEAGGQGRYWPVDSEPRMPAAGSYLVCLTSEKNPRIVRDVIEKINAWANAAGEAGHEVRGAGLFFAAEVDAEKAVEARTIAELMGI